MCVRACVLCVLVRMCSVCGWVAECAHACSMCACSVCVCVCARVCSVCARVCSVYVRVRGTRACVLVASLSGYIFYVDNY